METKTVEKQNPNKTKEPKTPFHAAYLNIPQAKGQRVKVRNKIVKECGTNSHSFYFWMHNITAVPFLAKPVIAKIFDIPQSELFPEDD